ncbi:MAG TPA: phenylalanine--tRNA ligase subunit beta, partial [Patescibacteria group bacterium]|nr:phenylalanine--tRNA ligase subunit beta [Patescibacteria group bacterium]
MKIPLSWLQTYVKPSLSLPHLADALSLTSIGTTLDGKDVLDLEVTFNRGDLLSVLGAAREVATICKAPLTYAPVPEKSFAWKKQTVSSLSVEIHDKKLCPFYALAKIEGVKLGFSPKEIQDNLKKAGMRPINNLVDITNYIMLSYGQPLHAFDATKVTHEKIQVRRASSDEKIKTLDGKERKLQKDMLLICDPKRPVAVAGVMGGEDSEVSGKTTTILLEAAIFDPISIRSTARSLGLRSEASSRFEHGLTEENLKQALHEAITLYETLTGGKLTAYKEVGTKTAKRYKVLVPESKVIQLLGETVPINESIDLLKRLGCEVKTTKSKKGYTLTVIPPYWRSDLVSSADIVEEIARMRGYEKIRGELPVGNVPPQRTNPLSELTKDIKLALVGCGYDEMNSPSFVSGVDLQKIGFRE